VTSLLEKDIEAAVASRLNQWARDKGIKLSYLKLTIPGNRGYPDRLILADGGRAIFVEFKRPGETPRKLQVYTHEWLKELGFEVQVHDTVDGAMEKITAYLDSTSGAGAWDEANSAGRRRAAILASGKRQDLGCAEVVQYPEEERPR
jgi:hypothetical protein